MNRNKIIDIVNGIRYKTVITAYLWNIGRAAVSMKGTKLGEVLDFTYRVLMSSKQANGKYHFKAETLVVLIPLIYAWQNNKQRPPNLNMRYLEGILSLLKIKKTQDGFYIF